MSSPRGAAAIVHDLYACTSDMMRYLEDADMLIELVEKRQALSDEFAARKNSGEPLYASDSVRAQAESYYAKINEMTPKIIKAMERHRDEAKTQLTSLKTNQRVLRYTNSAISGSGSYMDYKK
jgi:hypothetical protein